MTLIVVTHPDDQMIDVAHQGGARLPMLANCLGRTFSLGRGNRTV
jgi:hypothetical protein